VVEVVETKKRAGRQQPPFESSRYEISLARIGPAQSCNTFG
jgi:hypothetical protein